MSSLSSTNSKVRPSRKRGTVSSRSPSRVKQQNQTKRATSKSPQQQKHRRQSSADAVTDVWAPKANEYSIVEWAIRTYIGPFVLCLICPLFVNLAALTMVQFDGSIQQLAYSTFTSREILVQAFPLPNARVVKVLLVFTAFQFLSLMFLPGPKYFGPISPAGEQPVHTRNGEKAFALTFIAMFLLVQFGLLDPCIVYDELLPLMTCLNVSALVLSAFLLVKGVYFPSTRDHGSHYPWVFRFYEGEELYPSVFGVDLKNFVICRLGMIGWAVFTVSFVCASYRENGNTFTIPLLGSASLNYLYVVKFFFFYEEGYMSAGDIAVDRFGFMLSFGTVAFMPLVHNLHTLHLVKHSGWTDVLSSPAALIVWIALGLFLIFLNYDSDTQKHYVRKNKGDCIVWGKPCEYIKAQYVTADGKEHESILVISGYTGISRHFHYLPDIILLFMYCSPAGFDRLLPFTYFFYLTALLLDRCFRIDKRCQVKYGKFWDEYCKRVPYRLIPGVF